MESVTDEVLLLGHGYIIFHWDNLQYSQWEELIIGDIEEDRISEVEQRVYLRSVVSDRIIEEEDLVDLEGGESSIATDEGIVEDSHSLACALKS